MSSFFTIPSAQKKRKRNESGSASATKRSRNVVDTAQKSRARKPQRDESISGSESDLSVRGGDDEAIPPSTSGSDDEDDEDETGAERRLKLAERYLENVKSQVAEQQAVGFDAEEIDRDLIAERLKEDVAETKGRLYRYIATDYDYALASSASFRHETHCTTSVATCPPYAYTVSYDLTLTKWQLPVPSIHAPRNTINNPKLPRRRPTKLAQRRGSRQKASDKTYQRHTAPILCVAASEDGKFVATGGADHKLIIWSATDLKPLRVFSQHRDSVTSLAFRRGTNQLYSASADRTIKTWSLDELAYVETLFGHADQVVDVAALAQERCLSAGARDRTVRLWKVVDETQLVFRAGGGEKKKKDKRTEAEGSVDRVVFVDDDTFVTGSDNGALSLWTVHKKKPVYQIQAAGGRDPQLQPEDVFAEQDMRGREVPVGPQARWITALRGLPYSDLLVTGSWDGEVRIWRVTPDRKKIEAVGCVGRVGRPPTDIIENHSALEEGPNGQDNHERVSEKQEGMTNGVINDLAVFEREDKSGDDGKGRAGLVIVAALGRHHRLGKWKKVEGGKNGAVVLEIPKKSLLRKKAVEPGNLIQAEE